MKRLCILLTILLFLCLAGCHQSSLPEVTIPTQPKENLDVPTTVPTVLPETTEPTVVTEPPETTAPPTEPPETSEPPKHTSSGNLQPDPGPVGVVLSQEILDKYQFAMLEPTERQNRYQYHYAGESPEVTMPGGELSITLPEGWVSHVTIRWYRQNEDVPWNAAIYCTELIRAWAAYNEGISPEEVTSECFREYMRSEMLFLLVLELDDTTTVADPRGYLGRDTNYKYYFMIPEFWEERWYEWQYRQDMMEALGEDTYNTLLNGMVITEEMAREMITITNLVEDGE